MIAAKLWAVDWDLLQGCKHVLQGSELKDI